MFQDRKAYLRDVTHSVTVCRNKLDVILKKIGWTHHSLQKQALVDTKNEPEEQGPVEDVEVEVSEQNIGHSLPGNSTKTYDELVESIANQSKIKTKKKKDTELLVEMLAMERDSKRRRTSYKHKVHTKNKSHTEILREVLEQQMEYLKGNESAEKPINNAQMEQKLIEIDQIDCINPYLVWKNIDKYIKNNGKTEEKHEHKRRRSPSYERDRSRIRHRSPSYERDRSRKRHRSSSYERDRSRKRHRSHSKHKKDKKHRSRSRSRKHKSHKSSHSKKHKSRHS